MTNANTLPRRRLTPLTGVLFALVLAAGASVWLAERKASSSRVPSVPLLLAALLAGCASYGAATSPGKWAATRWR